MEVSRTYMNDAKKLVRSVHDNPKKPGFQSLWTVVEMLMKESYKNGQLRAEGRMHEALEEAWQDGFEAGRQEARSHVG